MKTVKTPHKYFVKKVVLDEVKLVQDDEGYYCLQYVDSIPYWKDAAIFESLEACLSFLNGATSETVEMKKQVWHIIHQ